MHHPAVAGNLNPAGQITNELARLRSSTVLGAEMLMNLPVTVYPVIGPEGLIVFTANLTVSTIELAIGNTADLTTPAAPPIILELFTDGVLRLPFTS